MIAASRPVQRPADARLLEIDAAGLVHHRRRSDLAGLLAPGDVVVANDAATIPASLRALHGPTGQPIELRLAGRDSLSPLDILDCTAVVFGAGDYHTRTEDRALPPPMRPGDDLHAGRLPARIVRTLDHPRLVRLRFQAAPADVWRHLARHGRPVQYAHVPEPLALWDVWTPIAAQPVAFESPSAGFVLSWSVVAAVAAAGAQFVTLTHAAGLSSTGDPALDARLPLDEPYTIPAATAGAVNRARTEGRRVIAVGTTTVRALEDAAHEGTVRAGNGLATRTVGRTTPLRVVDALLSGTHEPGTSHYALLQAFVPDEVLDRMTGELDGHGYRTHEFGDSVFVARRGAQFCRSADAGSIRVARRTGT